MLDLAITLAWSAVFIGLVLRANARFRAEERLPMQWLLPNDVVKSAPRAFALGLIPALGIGALLFLLALTWNLTPRPGQEWLETPALILLGAVFAAIQSLHIRLIERSLGRPRR